MKRKAPLLLILLFVGITSKAQKDQDTIIAEWELDSTVPVNDTITAESFEFLPNSVFYHTMVTKLVNGVCTVVYKGSYVFNGKIIKFIATSRRFQQCDSNEHPRFRVKRYQATVANLSQNNLTLDLRQTICNFIRSKG